MVSHLLFYALPPLTYRVAAFECRTDRNNSTERSNPMAKRLFWLGVNAVVPPVISNLGMSGEFYLTMTLLLLLTTPCFRGR